MQKQIIKNLLDCVTNPFLTLATMDLPKADLENFYQEFYGSDPLTFCHAEGLTLAQCADLEAKQLGYSGLEEVLNNMAFDNRADFSNF